MTFSQSQYETLMNELDSGMTRLSAELQKVAPTVNQTIDHWWIPAPVADALVACGQKLIDLGSWMLTKLGELLEGAAAPVRFFFVAHDWETAVRHPATEVAGNLAPAALPALSSWHGSAASAYKDKIKPQQDATSRIGVLADKTSTTLNTCAVAGCAFYFALGIILVKFIAAMITALVALGSVVFSWAGAAIIIEEAGVNTALVLAAVAALLGTLYAQAAQISTLAGEAGDLTVFPGGAWPNARSAQFSDATVTDGDADWSLST